MYPKLTVVEVLDLFRSFYRRSLPTEQLIDFLDLGERRNAPDEGRSPAASGSACRSPWRWSTTPRWCSSTSRRPAWTRPPGARSGSSSGGSRPQGKTILLTTHYMEEAETLCDRLAIMDHGKVLEMGTVGELVGAPVQGTRRPVRRGSTGSTTPGWPGCPPSARVKHEEGDVGRCTRATCRRRSAACSRATERAGHRAGEPDGPPGHARGRLPRPDRPSAAGLRRRPMHALIALTIANIRSFVRDRAALFWTLAFPVIFIILFGTIFSGGGRADEARLGRQRRDAGVGGAPPAFVVACRSSTSWTAPRTTCWPSSSTATCRRRRRGPEGLRRRGRGGRGRRRPAGSSHRLHGPEPVEHGQHRHRSRQRRPGARRTSASSPPATVPRPPDAPDAGPERGQLLRPEHPRACRSCSSASSARMPLVADRQKLILKRLSATPLQRWQLVGSNIVMRLIVAARPDDDHRRASAPWCSSVRSPAASGRGRHRAARRDGVHLARLRHRLVRPDRGLGQRDGQRHPVPADVPVGHVLPDRGHARRAARAWPASCRSRTCATRCARSWSTARRSRRSGSAWPCSPAGPWCASASRPASSSGSESVAARLKAEIERRLQALIGAADDRRAPSGRHGSVLVSARRTSRGVAVARVAS